MFLRIRKQTTPIFLKLKSWRVHTEPLSILGFPFAKRLRNFCETKRKIFLSLRISFARKNSNLRNHSQKSFRAKIALFRFFETGVLRNSAISLWSSCIFLGIEMFLPVSEFWKNLVLECLAKLLLVTLNILDQWETRHEGAHLIQVC